MRDSGMGPDVLVESVEGILCCGIMREGAEPGLSSEAADDDEN